MNANIKMIDLGIQKNPEQILITHVQFRDAMEKVREFTQIYTDGSKPETENNVGIGIYCPNPLIQFSCKLDNSYSIFSTELMAITFALRIIEGKNINKAMILTVSKSAIQNIAKEGIIQDSNYLTLRIKSKLEELKRKNFNIYLTWIPGH